MPQQRLSVVLLWALLGSCATLNTVEPTQLGDVTMPLAPPIAPARRVVQQITAHWAARQETMLCVLELDKQHIAMAGLSNDGLSLFNLSYNGKTLNVDKSPLLPDSVSPEFIIADLQLVYWPVAELQKILPGAWRLVATKSQRSLYYQEQKIVEVNYLGPDSHWAKAVELTNYRYHYQLHIKTISYEALPE
jgi:hypothetical protein